MKTIKKLILVIILLALISFGFVSYLMQSTNAKFKSEYYRVNVYQGNKVSYKIKTGDSINLNYLLVNNNRRSGKLKVKISNEKDSTIIEKEVVNKTLYIKLPNKNTNYKVEFIPSSDDAGGPVGVFKVMSLFNKIEKLDN